MLDFDELFFAGFIAAYVSWYTLRYPFMEWKSNHDMTKPEHFSLRAVVYFPMWVIADALVATAWIWYMLSSGMPDAIYEAVVALNFFAVVLRDAWRYVYFGLRRKANKKAVIGALVVAVVLTLTAGTILVLYGVEATRRDEYLWISFGLYALYFIWVVVGPMAMTAVHLATWSKKSERSSV